MILTLLTSCAVVVGSLISPGVATPAFDRCLVNLTPSGCGHSSIKVNPFNTRLREGVKVIVTKVVDEKPNLLMKVYASNNFDQLVVESEANELITLLLLDENGRMVWKCKMNQPRKEFNMSNLPVGNYFLNVLESDQRVKTKTYLILITNE